MFVPDNKHDKATLMQKTEVVIKSKVFFKFNNLKENKNQKQRLNDKNVKQEAITWYFNNYYVESS